MSNGEQKSLARLLEKVTTLVRKTPEILSKSMNDVIDQNIEEDRQIEEQGRKIRESWENAARQPKTNHA